MARRHQEQARRHRTRRGLAGAEYAAYVSSLTKAQNRRQSPSLTSTATAAAARLSWLRVPEGRGARRGRAEERQQTAGHADRREVPHWVSATALYWLGPASGVQCFKVTPLRPGGAFLLDVQQITLVPDAGIHVQYVVESQRGEFRPGRAKEPAHPARAVWTAALGALRDSGVNL